MGSEAWSGSPSSPTWRCSSGSPPTARGRCRSIPCSAGSAAGARRAPSAARSPSARRLEAPMADTRYDVIIIGSGAGGGTLAHRLAPSGKRILLLERGEYVPREKENWDSRAVVVESRYHIKEPWLDKHGKEFHAGTHYAVGGNTKFYGAALIRLREKDFGEVRHHGGIS